MSHHYGGPPKIFQARLPKKAGSRPFGFPIFPHVPGYQVVITNSATKAEISFEIPRSKIFESNPQREITQDEVAALAHNLAQLLNQFLA